MTTFTGGSIAFLEAEHREILADLERYLVLLAAFERAALEYPGTVTADELAELDEVGAALEARYRIAAAAVDALRAGLPGAPC